MTLLTPASAADTAALTEFLSGVDLTVSGLDSPSVRIWTERDNRGEIIATTGFELSADNQHALVRSVAVHPSVQRTGAGTKLATFALARADEKGAERAWLFSRSSGQLAQEVAWSKSLRAEGGISAGR